MVLASTFGTAFANDIRTQRLDDNVHVIFGQGGNIAVIEHADNVTVIDSQFAHLYPAVKSEIANIAPNKAVRYLINTHGHNDHTNGNASFVADKATIIAHYNTAELIKAYNATAKTPNALPHLTFDRSLTLHADEPIQLSYFANAHTNGDVIVHLPKSNIIHAGDILFFGRFPFIDVKNGGTIDGMINGLNGIIKLADDNTKIIAGHGNVASKSELITHTKMLTTIKNRVAQQKRQGKTLAQIQAARPAKEWETSHNWDFINSEKLVESIYQSLK